MENNEIMQNQDPSAENVEGSENVDLKEAFMSFINALKSKWSGSDQIPFTTDIAGQLSEIKALLRKEQRYEKAIEEKDELIKRLHNEVLSLNASFYESLKKPFMESVIMIHKWLESQDKLLKDDTRSREEIVELVSFNFKRVRTLLEEEYKLKLFIPSVGDLFSPEEHVSVQQDKTDDKNKMSTIKSVVTGGFKNKNGIVVERSEVITWQYNPNEEHK